jgi:putative intracellular protease/amidase
MLIGIPVFDDVDTLEIAGTFELFQLAGLEVELAAQAARLVRFRNGPSVAANTVFDDAGNAEDCVNAATAAHDHGVQP